MLLCKEQIVNVCSKRFLTHTQKLAIDFCRKKTKKCAIIKEDVQRKYGNKDTLHCQKKQRFVCPSHYTEVDVLADRPVTDEEHEEHAIAMAIANSLDGGIGVSGGNGDGILVNDDESDDDSVEGDPNFIVNHSIDLGITTATLYAGAPPRLQSIVTTIIGSRSSEYSIIQPEPEEPIESLTNREDESSESEDDSWETVQELDPLPDENDLNYPQEDDKYFKTKRYVRTDKYPLSELWDKSIKDFPTITESFS